MKEFIQFVLLWIVHQLEPAKPMSTSTGIGPDVPLVTAAIGLADTIDKHVAQVDAEENDAAHDHAALENHATAAIDKLNKAIQTKDLDTIRKMAQPLIAILALVFALTSSACSGTALTHAPDPTDHISAYYDPSTPKGYDTAWNSGYLKEIQIGELYYMVITTNRAKGETQAIPYTDDFGNHVFLLPVSVISAEYKAKMSATVAKRESEK